MDELPFFEPDQRTDSLEKYDLNDDGKAEYLVGFDNEYFVTYDDCICFILNECGALR